MVRPLLLLALLLLVGGCGDRAPTPIPVTPTTVSSIPANLVGIEWKLVSYGPASAPTAALPQTEVTLEFEQNGKISGSAGCNGYFGSVTIDGEKLLQTSPVGNTVMGCVDKAVTAQETAFLEAFYEVESIKVVDSTLTLGYPDGELVFTKP